MYCMAYCSLCFFDIVLPFFLYMHIVSIVVAHLILLTLLNILYIYLVISWLVVIN